MESISLNAEFRQIYENWNTAFRKIINLRFRYTPELSSPYFWSFKDLEVIPMEIILKSVLFKDFACISLLGSWTL